MQISYIQIKVPGIKRSLLCFLFENIILFYFGAYRIGCHLLVYIKIFLLKQTF